MDGRVLAPVKTQLCLMVKDRGQRSRLQYKVRPFGETEEAEMLSLPDTLEFLLPGNFFPSWYVNAPRGVYPKNPSSHMQMFFSAHTQEICPEKGADSLL